MARKQKDVFGFDELQKSFDRLITKYPTAADAALMSMGRAVLRRVKQLTPVKTKRLKNSWRLKKVKLYKNGTVRVVRIQSTAPHAHLIEDGHAIYRGSGRGQRGRRSAVCRAYAITGNRVEGRKMLDKSMEEMRSRFDKNAEKIISKLTKEFNQ